MATLLVNIPDDLAQEIIRYHDLIDEHFICSFALQSVVDGVRGIDREQLQVVLDPKRLALFISLTQD